MKIKTGALVSMLSGAFGNLVASRGRGGAYIRSRVIPTLVSNDFTNDVRNRFSTVSKAWAALTDVQKEAWRTFAATHPVKDRLGDSIVLQPSASFIQINCRVLQAGGTLLNIPPITAAPAAVSSPVITASAATSTVSIAFDDGPLAASCKLAIWVSVLDSLGRSYYKNSLALVKLSAAAATTPQAVGTEIEARFGDLIEGQMLHVELEVWDNATGLTSGRVYAKAAVAA